MINWLCVNYKDETIYEILLLYNDGVWSCLERGKVGKICHIHKYFEQFNMIMKKNNSEEEKVDEFLKLSNDKDFLFTFNEVD